MAQRPPGRVAIGGLVVTRQHPMTAKGTVFLAVEDETGMVATLWPDTWARLRGVVRRHALLYIEGTLQREANVVNLVAREIVSLPDLARGVGGPSRPARASVELGHAGMRRLADAPQRPDSHGSAAGTRARRASPWPVTSCERPERACRASSRALRFCCCACLSTLLLAASR